MENSNVSQKMEPWSIAADATLAALKKMLAQHARVRRGGKVLEIAAENLVPGDIVLLEAAEETPTPLQIQLDGLGKRLAVIAGVVVTLIFVLGILRGDPLVQTILTSIALAVAAIPEGLPAVVTVTLAIGMHRMAKNRAIVKKLSAVETLGCTTVICSDMTGTAIVGLLYRPPGRVLKTVGWTSLFLFPIYLVNTYVLYLYGE